MDILLSSTYPNNFWETAKLQSITACNVKSVVTLNEMVYPVVGLDFWASTGHSMSP